MDDDDHDLEEDPIVTETAHDIGLALRDWFVGALGEWDESRPRSKQKAIGFSGLGGCREFIRATIAGDEQTIADPDNPLKWPAFVGTWVGEGIESALKAMHPEVRTQVNIELKMPNGIIVSGNSDELGPDWIVDNKTKNGLARVRREGPSQKERIQISGYLIGAIQMELLPGNATGHLMFFDRSGAEKIPHVWSIDVEAAQAYLDKAEHRLADVTQALATGTRATRDEPESWCWSVACPFYNACWGGSAPSEKITDPKLLHLVDLYLEGKSMEDEGSALRQAAREELHGVEGVTEKHSIEWKVVGGKYGDSERLNVRKLR